MNELLFFLTTIVSFTLVLVAYRLFGKVGMWVWMCIATIIANIEVAKCVDIFGLAATLGNVIYGSTFLSTDILSENHGDREAKRSVWIGFFYMLVTTALLQLSLLFIPNASDFASPAMKTIFSLVPRFVLASILCFLISNRLDIFLFKKIGERTGRVWVKNNLATMTAQLVDSVLFTFLAFWGVFEFPVLLQLIGTTYVMKFLIAIMDTPFLYLAKRMKRNNKVGAVINL